MLLPLLVVVLLPLPLLLLCCHSLLPLASRQSATCVSFLSLFLSPLPPSSAQHLAPFLTRYTSSSSPSLQSSILPL
ncbi:uncharacterized protein UTRI_01836 [Ustilago trichophora]|uniref:Secreted peptide n=1 Tax=Ustilago trichophora TaxID=86804 RepID=A0A5C3DY71_9BASI|nr:uncharacterized protein UTRI_01836 [Ustilago trichophora]